MVACLNDGLANGIGSTYHSFLLSINFVRAQACARRTIGSAEPQCVVVHITRLRHGVITIDGGHFQVALQGRTVVALHSIVRIAEHYEAVVSIVEGCVGLPAEVENFVFPRLSGEIVVVELSIFIRSGVVANHKEAARVALCHCRCGKEEAKGESVEFFHCVNILNGETKVDAFGKFKPCHSFAPSAMPRCRKRLMDLSTFLFGEIGHEELVAACA